MKPFNKIIIISIIALFASVGTVFSNWSIINPKVESDIVIDKVDDVAVCYTKSDNQKYSTIEKGLEIANSRSSETLILNLGETLTLSSSITIQSGTTLLIPHNSSLSSYSNASSGSVKRTTMLNTTNGADIIVEEGGYLILGGQFGTKGFTGEYAQISLGNNSSIVVNGRAQLYGLVVEYNVSSRSNLKKTIYDNSDDQDRFIKVSSTGILETAFYSYDMGSGTQIINKNDNGICPTYHFDFRNIRTYLTIEFGGYFASRAFVEISGFKQQALCGVVGPYEGSYKAMFLLSNGSISLEFVTSTSITKIYVDGDIKIGQLYIDVGEEINSDNFVIPISNLIDIYINKSFDTNGKSIKFLPGSHLTIGSGASFLVNGTSSKVSSVFFYEANTLIAIGITTEGTSDSVIINNGKIVVNEYGAIGGTISTENINATSSVDLTKVTNQNNLSISTKEGDTANYDIPPLTFKSDFYDVENIDTSISSGSFRAGYNFDSYDGKACYEGNFIILRTIQINIKETTYRHNAYEYTVYINSSNNDTGATIQYEKITNMDTNSFNIESGTYLKIVDSICESIKINDTSYTSNTWILISGASNVVINPKEGFLVQCKNTNGTSGAGNTSRSINYGKDESSIGTYSVSVTGDKGIEAIIPSGWKFKVKDDASVKSDGTSKVVKTTYDANGNATETILYQATAKLAWNTSTVFTADGDYYFTCDKFNCLVEGIDILMSNGTTKKIENLHVGDIVKVFNHETGLFDNSPIIFITHIDDEPIYTEIIELKFDNGKTLDIATDHALLDKSINQYVIINADNAHSYLGHTFALYDIDTIGYAKLISYSINLKYVRVYCPVTAYHLNVIANNFITMPTIPYYDIYGLYNFFDLDDDMKYNPIRKAIDIDTYGLFSYEEFIKIIEIPYELFASTPCQYLKISIGKGLITEEEIRLGIEFMISNNLINF